MPIMRYGDARLKMIKIGIAFLCLLTMIAGIFFSLRMLSPKEDAVCKALRKIPPDEKWFLDYFFRNLLLRDGAACVLNGCKPAGVSSFFGPEYYKSTILWGGFKRSTLFRKGHEIWKKYQHLFPSSNYCFCYYEDKEEDELDVFLINKNFFLSSVTSHIEEFKKVLGSSITPARLLDLIIDKKKSLTEILNHDRTLLGIILGYGKHNASLFHRRYVLENAFIKRHDLLEKEIKKINERLQSHHNEKSHLLFSFLPNFVCDPTHPETQELHNGYIQQRKEFNELYRNGNFLEVTLKKITSNG